MYAWSDCHGSQRKAWEKLEQFPILYLYFMNNNTQSRILYHAKLFAYDNNMPWGLVNYEYKGQRSQLGPPLALYSRLPFRIDLVTRPPTPQGIRVLEYILQTLRLVWAHPKPERFPIPYLSFMNNNTQSRILYYQSLK